MKSIAPTILLALLAGGPHAHATDNGVATEIEAWYRTSFAPPFANRAPDIPHTVSHYRPGFEYLDIPGQSRVDDVTAFISGFMQWLEDSDWVAGELLDVQTRALNDYSGMLVAEWKLTAADGTVLGACPGSSRYFYIVSKAGAKWEIVLEGVLSCDSDFSP